MQKRTKRPYFHIGILFFLLGLIWLAGCSGKPVSETTPARPAPVETVALPGPPPPVQNLLDKTVTQQEAAEAHVGNLGYTIQVNSGANFDLQLPNTFSDKVNGIRIGELLRQRNELSRQNSLDFSAWLGKKVSLYTYAIESADNSSASIDLVMDGNRVIGFWIDDHTAPPDFNVIVSAYQAQE